MSMDCEACRGTGSLGSVLDPGSEVWCQKCMGTGTMRDYPPTKPDYLEGYERKCLVVTFNDVAKQVHSTAKEKGWWDTDRNDGEMLALIHAEVSEALEALRAGNPPDDKIPEFTGAEAELADVIIRIMDLSEARGWRVIEALVAKIEFNKGREKMHGGKLF